MASTNARTRTHGHLLERAAYRWVCAIKYREQTFSIWCWPYLDVVCKTASGSSSSGGCKLAVESGRDSPPMGNSMPSRLGNLACFSALDHAYRCLIHHHALCVGSRIAMWTEWRGLATCEPCAKLQPAGSTSGRKRAQDCRRPDCAAGLYLARCHGMIRK